MVKKANRFFMQGLIGNDDNKKETWEITSEQYGALRSIKI